MSQEKLKSNVVEAPTMFIGVGGTGSKIVKKIYKLCSVEERENISFVCLDTNVNDLSDIQKDCRDIYCVQTSNTQTVGSYLDNDLDAAKNWFPKNAVIFDKTVSEGAGQLRAISRLAFNSTIKTGKIAPLYEAIDALFKKNGQAMKQALRVCVVSTASGGTGSGMILPFCMFLRDYVNDKYPNASVILRTLILLPETLDRVIKSNIEKESQRRNAYATIKEINAFMMKGSGFCDIEESLKRYKDLHIDVMDPGKKGTKSLAKLPCDFCFLLDGQDAEDATSNSFAQYQDQAALSLYEQNIGPMQKYAFSVEDNIIKELSNPGNYGRNRFGGIGAGRIIYPYEDVADYIAYDWAKASIGGNGKAAKWLKYDKKVRQQQAEDEKAGKSMDECTPEGQAYIKAVREMVDGEDPFSKTLVNRFQLNDLDARIESFLGALEEDVAAQVNEGKKISQEKNALLKLGKTGYYAEPENWRGATSEFNGLIRYRDAVKNEAGRIAKSTAEGILFTEEPTMVIAEKNGSEKFLEGLMRSGNRHYCHPNAARYILYALKEEADSRLQEFSDNATTISNKLNNYTRTKDTPYMLKSRKEGNEVASLKDLCEVVAGLEKDNRKGKKIGQEAEAYLSTDMKNFFNGIGKLQDALTKKAIYTVLSSYVDELCKEYKSFFDSFPKKVAALDSNQFDLVEELKYTKGDSVRNVCATKKMLEELSRSTAKAMESGEMLDDALNALIFDKIKANARFTRENKNADVVDEGGKVDIFDDVLLGYFKKSVREECRDIDMNIIDAIAREEKLSQILKARDEQAEGQAVTVNFDKKACIAHIKAVIEEGAKISAPGIQRMVGEEPREVNAYAYNKSLREMREYSVEELLPNGAAVDSVSRYELHYFNALYNLTPDKLKKFSAPRKSETGNRPSGLYHNAYTSYTRDIGPDCLKSSKMTTHIDRRWDSIAAMPELDLFYQQIQFLRTHKALVYGLVFGRIQKMKYLDDNSEVKDPAMAYRYRNTSNHIEDMVVSNGTLCDEFYEILDSLYIDRALVENIYAYEKKETAKDIMCRAAYSQTKFNEYVEKFKLDTHNVKRSSLFEIPLAYYNSLPSYRHDEAELNSLVEAVIDVFRKQITKYESEKNARFVLCGELEEQYKLLIKNYKDNSLSRGVPKNENKALGIIERKVQDVMEASPQPENYEITIKSMKDMLENSES